MSKAIRERAIKKETVTYGKMVRDWYVKRSIQLLNETDWLHLKSSRNSKFMRLVCEVFLLWLNAVVYNSYQSMNICYLSEFNYYF